MVFLTPPGTNLSTIQMTGCYPEKFVCKRDEPGRNKVAEYTHPVKILLLRQVKPVIHKETATAELNKSNEWNPKLPPFTTENH